MVSEPVQTPTLKHGENNNNNNNKNNNTVNQSFLRALGNTNPPRQGWSADSCNFLRAQERDRVFEHCAVSQYSKCFRASEITPVNRMRSFATNLKITCHGICILSRYM